MNNLILFINTFFSYLLVLVVVAILACVAIFIGMKLRKNKNKKDALAVKESSEKGME